MEFITQMAAEGMPVSTVCQILSCAPSTYYRRRNAGSSDATTVRAASDEAALVERIKAIKLEHSFWGHRRVTAFLRSYDGLCINRKRVRRLMRLHGLAVEIKTNRAKRTPTRSKPRPTAVNEWWGTDMTKFYVHTLGWVYFVVVIDWYTKKILGYQLNTRADARDWMAALDRAVNTACPLGARAYDVKLMSDNGSQPTSERYEHHVQELGITHVTTSYSNPKGNADTERFIRTFKEEVVWPNEFFSWNDAKAAVERFNEFYNQHYPHSTLGEISPMKFEQLLVAA